MASNTKLTDFQKFELMDFKDRARDEGVTLAHNGQTTTAFLPLGNTVKFALSVASPDEVKFRRKVGEYHALERFYGGQTVKMLEGEFCSMYELLGFTSKAERKKPFSGS